MSAAEDAQKTPLFPSLVGFVAPAAAISFLLFIVPLAFVASYVVSEDQGLIGGLNEVLGSRLVLKVFLTTVEISFTAAVVSVLLAYPVSLHISRQSPRSRTVFLTLVLVPFWTSILVKSYAFIIILGESGIVNSILRGWFGLDGFTMMFNRFAVIVGLSNFLIPFAVFPILSSLMSQDPAIRTAADVMGASPLRVFWSIVLPHSLPGIYAALLLCLVIAMGFFITPALLGGRQDMMIANIIDMYTREVLDWQSASVIAMLLLAFSASFATAMLKLQSKMGNGR